MSTTSRRITIIHGGPRKDWNTATLLEHVADGARAAGGSVERVDLYGLDFKGCRSCFACKAKGGASYGRCAQRDGLAPVLSGIAETDALVLGSPIYFGSVTGEMRSFLERLLFPFFTYTNPPQSIAPKRFPTAFVYTMNVDAQRAEEVGYWQHLGVAESVLARVFGSSERLAAFDTLQFEDYDRFVSGMFDPVRKARHRQEAFPQDCARARDLGARLAKG
ncbi:MAG TPA: flavodoxin family protein [Holophaga sp.]|nr:flavodoxin family protein [Holophaga sp.]